VSERGAVHPREVDDHFSHGTVTNYWGGSSSATTHLLDVMHYHGLLRVTRRESGIRIYAAHEHAPGLPMLPTSRTGRCISRCDRAEYAPLPGVSLSRLVARLRYAVPQWHGELKTALQRAKQRLSHARVNGIDWYWPAAERLPRAAAQEIVRLLAPFDPVVWDRHRFELFWGWATVSSLHAGAQRKLGYYALPLLWRDRVIGWGNVSVKNGELRLASIRRFKATAPIPRSTGARAELDRMRIFLPGTMIVWAPRKSPRAEHVDIPPDPVSARTDPGPETVRPHNANLPTEATSARWLCRSFAPRQQAFASLFRAATTATGSDLRRSVQIPAVARHASLVDIGFIQNEHEVPPVVAFDRHECTILVTRYFPAGRRWPQR